MEYSNTHKHDRWRSSIAVMRSQVTRSKAQHIKVELAVAPHRMNAWRGVPYRVSSEDISCFLKWWPISDNAFVSARGRYCGSWLRSTQHETCSSSSRDARTPHTSMVGVRICMYIWRDFDHELVPAQRVPPITFLSVQDAATVSSRCLLNESVLQFAHFSLEGFDFLPAVERPFVVVAQTLHQAVLGLLDLGRHLVHLFALLEPLAQVHDFFADAVVGSIRFASGRLRVLLAPVVVERRAEVR